MPLRNRSLILDANCYRNVAHNIRIDNCSEIGRKWKSLDIQQGVKAYASPIVIWELVFHLAERADPAYSDCLKALILLCEHTRSDNDPSAISAVAHPTVNLCNNLFGLIPEDANATQNALIDLVYIITDDPLNLAEATKKRIRVMAKSLAKIKKDWVSNMIALTRDESAIDGDKWFKGGKKKTRKLLRTFYQSKEFGRMFAVVIASNAAKDVGIDSITPDELLKLSSIVEVNYPAVIQFNSNFFEKLPSPYRLAFESKKARHANNAWDAALCYHINEARLEGRKVVLVSDDKAIRKASADVGLSNAVMKLCEYLPDSVLESLITLEPS